MTSRELTEWMAYERLEPWGEERADYRSALLASLVYNRTRGKNEPAKKPADFMPKFEPPERPTSENLLAVVEQLNRRFGGRDLRSK